MHRLFPIFILLGLLVGHSLADECGTSLTKLAPGRDCTITKDTVDIKSPGLVKIIDAEFFSKDSFKIKIGNQEEDVNCFGNCLLVLPPQQNYEFHVVTSNETAGYRRITKIEVPKPKLQLLDVEKFTVIIKPNVAVKEIEFINNASDVSSVLISTSSPGVKAQPLKVNNEPTGPEISFDVQDFLTEMPKFKLNFNVADKTRESVFNFEQMLVTRNCSYAVDLKDKVELKTVDKSSVLSRTTHTCVYLVNGPTGGNLEVASLDLKSSNDYDTIVVKDGLKLTAKNLISSNSKNAADYLGDLSNRLSSTNNLLVILTSNFAAAGQYEQGLVTIKQSALIKTKDATDKFEMSTDRTYIIQFETGFPYLQFDKKFQLTAANLTVYDRLLGEPILTYQQNDWIFSELWSGKSVLVLNFTAGAKVETLTAKLLNKTVSCSQIVHGPASFMLNSSSETQLGKPDLDSQTCHFYFAKPEATQYPIGLSVQNLALGPGACLQLTALSEANTKFSICYKDNDIIRDHPTDFVLRSNDSYILSYLNQKTYPKNRILLQASFSYHGVNGVRSYNLTKESPSINISSFDFPNNYPYYLDDRVAGIDQVTTDTRYLAVSFAKYHLRTGDELSFIGKKLNFTADRPDDFVHLAEQSENQTTLLTSFTTKFAGLDSLLADEHAQGYKLEFERYSCVLVHEKEDIVQTPGYPKAFVNATRCILFIDLTEKDTPQYLSWTVENKNENLDFGVLTVYDDASWQRANLSKVFDQKVLKDNQTFSFNTSSTKVVVLFDPLDKTTVNGFQMTIKKEKCSPLTSCDGGTRCVLSEIHCNWIAECLDGQDEIKCSNSDPQPPTERIVYILRGLSGWVITLFIIPLSMVVGGVMHWKWPVIQARLRGGSHSYREFSSFNSENA